MLHDTFVPKLIPVQLCPLSINHENARVTEESVMYDAQVGGRATFQSFSMLIDMVFRNKVSTASRIREAGNWKTRTKVVMA